MSDKADEFVKRPVRRITDTHFPRPRVCMTGEPITFVKRASIMIGPDPAMTNLVCYSFFYFLFFFSNDGSRVDDFTAFSFAVTSLLRHNCFSRERANTR